MRNQNVPQQKESEPKQIKEGISIEDPLHLRFQSLGEMRKTIPQGAAQYRVSEPEQDRMGINMYWQPTRGIRVQVWWGWVSS